MIEGDKKNKNELLFIEDPQDELYGKQRKIKILNLERVEDLCLKKEAQCFVSFSDNTLESLHVFDSIIKYSRLLKLIGVIYEPVNQPIYCFASNDEKYIINIKICGHYSAWDLPQSVNKIIRFADIPDIVICKFNKIFTPIAVIETTGTANVGNSQWQREGRKLGAMITETPLIYQTYYSGTDRSQEPEGGQPREPTSLQVINHIIYSIRYSCPSFVIYYSNPDVDHRLGFKRSPKEGKYLMGNYLSALMLNSAFGICKEEKAELEKRILIQMKRYLQDTVIKRRKSIIRLDNDLPVLTKKQRSLLLDEESKFYDFIIKRLNGKNIRIESEFNILDWDYNNFFKWEPGNIEDKPLIKDLRNSGLNLLSYKKGISKVGICLDTSNLKKIIQDKYNPDRVDIGRLKENLPTLIFPGRIWKGEGKVESGDPESGELYAFRELLALDLEGNKIMNVLLYIFVVPPDRFRFSEFIKKDTKLTRSFRYNADIVIINNKVQKHDIN